MSSRLRTRSLLTGLGYRRLFMVFIILISALAGYLLLREGRQVWLEAKRPNAELSPGDCAVVLTGGAGRLREGFDLLAQRQVRRLIISGVHPQAQLREIFPQWPYYGEVREQDVTLERRSRTTFGNVQQTLILVEALRCRDLTVITSSLHLHRALRSFRASFPEGYALRGRATQKLGPRLVSLEFGVEVLKSAFYSLWAY